MELGSMFSPSTASGGSSSSGSGNVKPNIPDIYKAELIVERDGGEILRVDTPLPENFMLGLNSSWDNPFNQPLSNFASSAAGGGMGQGIGAAGTGVTAATGFTSLNKWLSGAVWTGGSMLKLDIPFVIQAHEDTQKEVAKVMKDLMKLVAPSEGAGKFLRAPGPYAGDPTSGKVTGDIVTVNIGKFFTMSPCVVDGVTCTFDTQVDSKGIPISATVNVSVLTYFTTTQEDLDKFFQF